MNLALLINCYWGLTMNPTDWGRGWVGGWGWICGARGCRMAGDGRERDDIVSLWSFLSPLLPLSPPPVACGPKTQVLYNNTCLVRRQDCASCFSEEWKHSKDFKTHSSFLFFPFLLLLLPSQNPVKSSSAAYVWESKEIFWHNYL